MIDGRVKMGPLCSEGGVDQSSILKLLKLAARHAWPAEKENTTALKLQKLRKTRETMKRVDVCSEL